MENQVVTFEYALVNDPEAKGYNKINNLICLI
jgi:hypothetical protein